MGLRLFFLLSLLIGALAVILTTEYFSPHKKIAKNIFNDISVQILNFFGYSLGYSSNPVIFTKEELKHYDGMKGSKGLYLAILGKVYDVSRGTKHYGPGGGYHFFTGKDASRAFVTGNFKPSGLIDDVSKLTPQDILGLVDWMDFYQRDYTYVGKVAGKFYTLEGKPTKALHDFRADVKNAKRVQKAEKEDAIVFPPCNSEWKQGLGGRVWCSNMSGGVKRDWVGVPRLYHKPGRSSPRCACVRNRGPPTGKSASEANTNNGDLANPNMKEYPNCPPDSDSCRTTD